MYVHVFSPKDDGGAAHSDVVCELRDGRCCSLGLHLSERA